MWVLIKKVIDDETYFGELNNVPALVKNIEAGEDLTFKRSEISELYRP